MDTKSNIALVTGGATGIGFAIAESLLKEGNTVIICGRRKEALDEAKAKLPGVYTFTCDISNEHQRQELYAWMEGNFKDINILVNNAGVQRQIDFKKGDAELANGVDEIEINLKSQIALITHFVPIFSKQKHAAIVNITSGLAFVPRAQYPIYCATKAALHSLTISMRHQLKDTQVKVFEIIPPIVHDTDLKGKDNRPPKSDRSSSSAEVAAAMMDALQKDEYEVAVGAAQGMRAGSRTDPEGMFKNMNSR